MTFEPEGCQGFKPKCIYLTIEVVSLPQVLLALERAIETHLPFHCFEVTINDSKNEVF